MRLLALAIGLSVLAPPAASEDLRSAFYGLAKPERMDLQSRLAQAGLYGGEIDGLWGPGTAGAFAEVQTSLAWPAHRELAGTVADIPPTEALWAFVRDPDMAATLPDWR